MRDFGQNSAGNSGHCRVREIVFFVTGFAVRGERRGGTFVNMVQVGLAVKKTAHPGKYYGQTGGLAWTAELARVRDWVRKSGVK
jgi:hypothetical protein